jgi:aerobic-type carbon monoxide dehydrogenase small subunit (CoxS/CutS family)
MSAALVRIFVNGAPVEARGDTTVAAVLLNAGVVAFRDSVRGAPRAPLCGMGVCQECRVTIDGAAHQRSCMMRVAADMHIDTPPLE